MSYDVEVGHRGCCGVKEIHSFKSGFPSESGDTPTQLINSINQQYKGYMMHMWFVKEWDHESETFDDEYQWEEVRKVVAEIPGCMEVGPFINPNSDNKVIGYMWLNGEICDE